MHKQISPTSWQTRNYIAVLLAAAVVVGWCVSLLYLLRMQLQGGWVLLGILWQSFLSMGLFITAHDCMHENVFPKAVANRRLGALCAFLFAGFSYQKLYTQHHRHHDHPATSLDPDYTDYPGEKLWPWLYSFIRRYFSWREFLWLHLHVGFCLWYAGSVWPMLLFFALPSWVASFSLFYFGTYLPHRHFQNSEEALPARSNSMPTWLSLLTCYHFGYHREHHLYPWLCWWQLPAARKKSMAR